MADKIVGGWQIAGITTLSTGNWYTITDGNGNFSNSDGGQRADLVPGQDPNGRPCVAGTFFNTCAFQDPPANAPASDFFGFGSAGRNIVSGPAFQQWDLSIFKIIPTSKNTFRIPDGDLQPSEPCKFPGSLRQFEAAGRRQLRLRYRRGRASADSVWLEILFLNFDDLKSPVLGPGFVDRIRPET